MKKWMSIILILVLAAALAVSPVLAANGDGDGSGGGNGQKQVTVESVTAGEAALKDAEIDPSGEIKVVFSNGMDNKKDANIASITITGAEVEVSMADKSTFVVKYSDLTAGDHELVVAKTATANNGTALQEDFKVAFKVKAAEEPKDEDPKDEDPEEEESHDKTCPSKDYKDVNADVTNWTHLPIDYVLEKGYMKGEAADKFNPDGDVLRATVVQVLYAKEGKPAAEKKAGFNDVAEGKWYTDAVSWAVANGVASGYDAKHFGPEDPVTREQLALMLKKYAELKKLDVSASGDLSKFKDQAKVHDWALAGVKWAVGAGLIAGMDTGNIEPAAKATRAQLAVILKAFDEKVDVEKVPADGEKPAEPEKPEESPAPAESATPAASETPAESVAPAASEAPVESAAPATSNAPAAA